MNNTKLAVLITFTLSLFAVLMYFYPEIGFLASLRGSLGITIVLLLPGYILVHYFFSSDDWLSELAQSFGFSLIIVSISFLITNLIIPFSAINNLLVIALIVGLTVLAGKNKDKLKVYFSGNLGKNKKK